MKNTPTFKRTRKIFWFFSLLMFVSASGYASHHMEVSKYKGSVYVSTGQAYKPYQKGTQITQGQTIQTRDKSFCCLDCQGSAHCRILENSTVTVNKFNEKDFGGYHYALESEMYLAEGRFFFDINKLNDESRYEIHTPAGIAKVRGTSAIVSYLSLNNNNTFEMKVTVIRGQVEVEANFGQIIQPVNGGQTATILGNIVGDGQLSFSTVTVAAATPEELSYDPQNTITLRGRQFTPSTNFNNVQISPAS